MPVYLRNEFLEVKIGEPGELYSGSRFDHSGNIIQVTLNNHHTFCTSEKQVMDNAFGFGLLNEFDIDCPQSFNKAAPGSYFLKTGVGTLLREDNLAYNFFNSYKFRPSEFKIEFDGNRSMQFENISSWEYGFQTKYRKEVFIDGNNLVINYYLKNIGSEKFETEEYCHNFLSIDQQLISDNYELIFNVDINPENFTEVVNPGNILNIQKNSITLNSKPDSDFFIAHLTGKTPEPVFWKLLNYVSKVGISEHVSFKSSKVNLWGNGHVISPELFFKTALVPQEETFWQRKYSFFEI